MIQMKKMAAAVAIAAASVGAQAVNTGDILFTGIASDTTNVTQWTMQTFADIAAGDSLNFTDTNYKPNGAATAYGFVGSTVSGSAVVGTPEAFLNWNVGATGIAAGTEVVFTMNKSTSALTASIGSITLAGGTINGFSGTADSLWAYNAGSSYNLASSFVSGLSTYSFGTNDYTTASLAAAGLNSTTMIGLSPSPVKYAYYNGPTTAADWATAKTAVSTLSNWSVSGVASSAALGDAALTITVAAVPEASTYAMLLAGLGMIGVIARRRTNA